MVHNPCVSPTSTGVLSTGAVKGSRSPPCVSLDKRDRDASGACPAHTSPPRPQHALRTASQQRFNMPPSPSMHVQHGGVVLPKLGGAGGVGSVDTHAPHALKVHCVTWNMGRMKVTSQLAVNLRGAFLGVPRGERRGKGPSCPHDPGAHLAFPRLLVFSSCLSFVLVLESSPHRPRGVSEGSTGAL